MDLNFDKVDIGRQLGELDKGVVTTAHIMRWSAAVENFHRIHYDQAFATGHDHLPGVLINGSWKQHVLVQLVKDSLGPQGWLWRLKFRYRKMDVAGDSLRAVARVVDKKRIGDLGFITLRVSLCDQHGELSTAGHAIGVVPARAGAVVPYPFRPEPAHREIAFPQDEA
ncbi:MAG: MaoC family dehydratase [Pseudomonadota bacterium]